MNMIQIFLLAITTDIQVFAFVESPADDLSISPQRFELQSCEPIDK